MAHCSLRALDLLSRSELLFFIFQRSSCYEMKKARYFISIDKRIAYLELLTQRYKLRSQFPYLLSKFGVVREFVSKTILFLLQQFHLTSATCNLESFEKPLLTGHIKGINLILKCFSSQFIYLILAGFITTNPIFSRDHFLN